MVQLENVQVWRRGITSRGHVTEERLIITVASLFFGVRVESEFYCLVLENMRLEILLLVG